jgi:autotransporter-associated beta strand protein
MDSASIGGQRTLPSATDVLVIAEDQGISDVKLARVTRISAGNWSDANAWIGGDVPSAAQDAYVTQGGTVSLDVNASVKSLLIDNSTVDAQGRALTSGGDVKLVGGTLAVGAGGSITSAGDIDIAHGTIDAGGSITSGGDVKLVDGTISVGAGGSITSGDVNIVSGTLSVASGGSVSADKINGDINIVNGSLSVASGGSISANKIDGDPATLTTAAGSTVEFNNFTRGISSATAATFNGNVTIGVGASTDAAATFNPDTAIATWTIGQNLKIGGSRSAKLVIDNGAWSVGGNLDIPASLTTSGEVVVDGGYLDVTHTLTGGKLDVTGLVTIGGALTYRGRRASNTTYTLNGGTAFIKNVPPTPPFLVSTRAGMLTFENTTQGVPIGASVDTAMINVSGGTGDGGDGAVVTFKGNSVAIDAEFWNGAGIGGISLRISNPVVIAGTGGRVIFEGDSYATTSHFRNDGVNDHGAVDSGGSTHFRDNSYASNAEFDNYGSTLQSYVGGGFPAPGGRTAFFDRARASFATFNNHPGQGMGALGAGVTTFSGNSTAANGTFYNKGGVPGAQHGGSVEFYENAKAGDATFYNEHALGVSQHAGSAGNVRFYGNSSAENATFYNQVGGGTVYFNDSSTAGDAHFFIEDTGTGVFYGHVVFNGNSKGGASDITVRENAFSGGVEFRGTSNAEHAEITFVNGSQAGMLVANSGNLGNATIDMGSGSSILFRESGSAGDSTIRFRPGGGGDFTGTNTTAADATITLDGATVANGGTGNLNFSGGRAGNATIYVNGGAVSGAAGAQMSFNNGANAGTATVIGGGGAVPGAGGARVSLDASSTAANATFTIGAGGYLNLAGFGDAQVGSLDVAGGAVHLGQTGLRIGALNTSNTISGQITGFFGNGNAKITKVGAGTLTLTGANTYYGLTKVDGGALAINGSTPGAVEVNSGATLMGTGSIGGAVTMNSGGMLAPGASPGKMTIGGLNLSSGSTLAMEIGGVAAGTQYDQVISTGAFSLAGALNVSLVNGFSPSAGQSFNLFDWGTASGSFSALSLPTLGGSLAWNTSQLYATGVLSVAAADLPGDFTGDGFVNAADLAAWQAGFGSGSTRAQGDSDGDADVDGFDFLAWQRQLGAGAPAVSANVPTPEPASFLLCVIALAAIRQIGGRVRQQLVRA